MSFKESLPNLQPKDMPNLERVLGTLKESGIETYVIGTATDDFDDNSHENWEKYRDIRRNNHNNNKLNAYVIGSVLEKPDYNDIDLIIPLEHESEKGKFEDAIKNLTQKGAKVLSQKRSEEGFGYGGTIVVSRHRMNYRGTIFDLSDTIQTLPLHSYVNRKEV